MCIRDSPIPGSALCHRSDSWRREHPHDRGTHLSWRRPRREQGTNEVGSLAEVRGRPRTQALGPLLGPGPT
eukprot:8047777-Alexandrium_andersonii.AAC.1